MTEMPSTEPVVVRVAERTATWDGEFTGDQTIVDEARFAAAVGATIQVGSHQVEAGDQSAFGAVAALFASDPGHTELMYAEDLIRDVLFGTDDDRSEHDNLDDSDYEDFDDSGQDLWRPHTQGA